MNDELREIAVYFAQKVGGIVIFGLIVLTATALLILPMLALIRLMDWLIQ